MAMLTFKNPGMQDAAKNRLLYPLNVWALSFGCAVGWGAFMMPGNLFLPNAGPIGSALAILIGGISMIIIGYNFCRLAVRYHGNGGIYAYTKNLLGYDHAFLAAWSLIITYLSIIWANATAVVLLARMLFGNLLQWGFHYQVAGFDVFFGEILTTWIVFLSFGAFSCFGGIGDGLGDVHGLRVEAHDDLMLSGRHLDGSQHIVGAGDAGRFAVHGAGPAGIVYLAQDDDPTLLAPNLVGQAVGFVAGE